MANMPARSLILLMISLLTQGWCALGARTLITQRRITGACLTHLILEMLTASVSHARSTSETCLTPNPCSQWKHSQKAYCLWMPLSSATLTLSCASSFSIVRA